MFQYRFAFRPPPLPDELLSSWIHRTAVGMLFGPYAFVHAYWNSEPPVLSRDIDLMGDQRVVAGMAFGTGTSLALAAATALPSLEGRVFTGCGPRGVYPWVLPIGVRNRERKLPGQQYCPHCLAEDDRPYLRKRWRLGLASTCNKHGCILLDRCQECRSTLMPFRSRALHVCWDCDADLRRAKTEPANADAIAFNLWADEVILNGWGSLGKSDLHYSPLLFSILRQLGRTIISGPRSQALRSALAPEAGVSDQAFAFEGGRAEVEFMNAGERHRMHAMISVLSTDWPWRYREYMSQAGMWHSWALRDMADVPFVLKTAVDEWLRPRTYSPPLAEVQEAAKYLAARNGVVSTRSLRRLIGDSIHCQDALAGVASPSLAPDLETTQLVPLPQE